MSEDSGSHLGEDELELSLFGPGVGECALVHLGWGDWAVIDSCRDRASGLPIAIKYLHSLGQEPAAAIRVVFATHWHDDHVGGMAEVLRAAPNAKFVCSAALGVEEFRYFVETGRDVYARSSGRDEFARIFDLLRERAGTSVGSPAAYAAADMCVLKLGDARPVEATIHSLSPSATSQTRFLQEIAALGPSQKQTKRCASATSANSSSVVLSIRVGGLTALFGADLEEHGRSSEGWAGVLSTAYRPNREAFVFKVPHHGSPNGDHVAVWEELLAGNPYALVSPFTPSRRPRGNDLDRLCKRTSRVYCTASPTGSQPQRREAVVEKTIRAVSVKNRRTIGKTMGHIRVRCPIYGDPGTSARVSLFRSAFLACQTDKEP